MSSEHRAVFLSYASQDAEAARRICDALRQAGVEVWFDAEGGLEHGDEWDAKIRRQIKECVLFIPIISANTQAREEGYFRIEWELAAQRALGIASGVAFILPVVVDDTREPDALVPDRFRTVQWTKARGGELTPEQRTKFAKLWSHRSGVLRHASGETRAESREPVTRPETLEPGTQNLPRPGWPAYAGIAAGILILITAVGWWLLRSSPPSSDFRPAVSSSNPPPSSVSSPQPSVLRPPDSGAASAASPARQLAAKSAALHDQLENASRSDLQLAEQYCQQALALDQNDSEVWAEYSLVCSNYIAVGYDRSNERLQSARAHAERAAKLAPDSREAQFALAIAYRWQGATQDEAIRRLRGLVDRMPGDGRVLRALGNALRMAGQNEEALLWYTRAAERPGGDPLALFQRAMALEALGRNAEAAASLDESLALHPGASAYVLKVFYLVRWGELEAARAALDKVPAPFLVEERGALAAGMVYLRQRQWDRCLAALLALPHDYVEDAYFRGPKGLLTGNARFHAGRKLAAEQDWRAALQLVNQRLAGTRDTTLLHLRKAELHARLQEADEADRALRTFEELQGGRALLARARIEVCLNRPEAAIQSLQAFKMTREVRVMLRQDPEWDPLRGDPRFEALLAEPAPASATASNPPPAAPSPARELVAKARALLLGLEATREDFALAEDYCQRALKLDPTDGEVWAIHAQLHSAFGYRGWDTSAERREQNRVMAERAIRLAPDSVEAKLAQAGAWTAFGINRPETEKLLREVVAQQPDNQPALRFLAVTLLNQGKLDECLALNERSAALPGGDPLALFNNARYLWQRSRPAEGYATLERSIAQQPFSSSLTLKTIMEITWRGDLAAAEATMQRIPQSLLLEDRANYTAGLLRFYQRRPAAALGAWDAFPRDYYADFAYGGPKGLLMGLAYEMDHREAAALIEWRTALQAVEKRLAATPNRPEPHYYKAYLLACLGEKAAAGEVLRTFEQLSGVKYATDSEMTYDLALVYARLGRFDEIFAQTPARFLGRLRIDPRFEALRADPRYAGLLAERERQNPGAKK